jgi:hypothetical protein
MWTEKQLDARFHEELLQFLDSVNPRVKPLPRHQIRLFMYGDEPSGTSSQHWHCSLASFWNPEHILLFLKKARIICQPVFVSGICIGTADLYLEKMLSRKLSPCLIILMKDAEVFPFHFYLSNLPH